MDAFDMEWTIAIVRVNVSCCDDRGERSDARRKELVIFLAQSVFQDPGEQVGQQKIQKRFNLDPSYLHHPLNRPPLSGITPSCSDLFAFSLVCWWCAPSLQLLPPLIHGTNFRHKPQPSRGHVF